MPTLTTGAPLKEVADILYAANLLGPSAWATNDRGRASLASIHEGSLKADLLSLFSILHSRNVNYVLVGGVAMLAYVDGRNSKNVDLILSVESLDRIPEIVISDRNAGFARGMFGSLRVDVLLSDNQVFRLVQEKYFTQQRFLETDIRCATVEGIILLKLYALPSLYRQGDGQRIGLYENDIFMLVERYRRDIEPLFDILSKHLMDEQVLELRNIIADIQRRIDRVDRARGTASPAKPIDDKNKSDPEG